MFIFNTGANYMKYLMLCIALATLVTPSRADELFNNSPVWNAVDTMYRLPDKFSDDSTVTLFTFYGCPTCTRVADWLNRNSEVQNINAVHVHVDVYSCLLYTSPSPRDLSTSRMPSSA